MAEKRLGLNATLTYPHGTARRAYRVRVNGISHGMKVIYDQQASRIRNAFYPHRLSSAQFAISLELKGQEEWISLSSWLATYAAYVLNPDLAFGEFPAMVVSVPSRNFVRKGVPLNGFDWGDNVGMMVKTPQIMFETSEEPTDNGKSPAISKFEGIVSGVDRDVRYFYPLSQQLSGQATPPDGAYTTVLTAADVLAMTADPTSGVPLGGPPSLPSGR